MNVATLTLNPSLDVSYTVPTLVAQQKVHATKLRFDPGGNGVNVARGLKELGIEAQAYMILAGEIGSFLERLLASRLDHLHVVKSSGETRINMTLLTENPWSQYEVDGMGSKISTVVLEEATKQFIDGCKEGLGILTGSVPPGVHRGIYADIGRRLVENSGRVVVDAQPSLLQAALPAKPYLIKPNKYELEILCGTSLPTLEAVVDEAVVLFQEGITNVCVSMDKDGAVLVNDSGVFYARVPPVRVVSTVGSGDSMVAGLVTGLIKGFSAEEVLRLGVACGSATATMPGTQIFSGVGIEELLKDVRVEKLG
ncbi:MAG: 1-phosphofructokinase family hexose kinase [Peptococcaceae bacterium]|jgi:6-phosphofructokinase 2|nr:1-phosphofructokinase family hexose kinase [Peptococcaceae bacterium]